MKNEAKVPFRIPEGVTLSPVNRDTGEPSYIGAPNFILEAFRPGTEPKIGALKSTIRYGTGTDSFGSYDYDYQEKTETTGTLEDIIESEEAGAARDPKLRAEARVELEEDADEKKATDDKAVKENNETSTEAETGEDTADEDNRAAETTAPIAPVGSNAEDVTKPALPEPNTELAPTKAPTAPPVSPAEEEDLDDGLY